MENLEKFKTNQILIDFLATKGLDEKQVAKKIGKDASTIYRITAKKTSPHKGTMIAIAKAYGLRPDYFFSLDGSNKASESILDNEAYQNLKAEVQYYRQLLLIASKKGLFALGTGVKKARMQIVS